MDSPMGKTISPQLTVDVHIPSVMWGRFVAPFLAGEEPYIRHLRLGPQADDHEALIPDDAVVARYDGDRHRIILAQVAGCTVLLQSSHGSTALHVRASTAAEAEKVTTDFASRIEPASDVGLIPIDFWQVSNGPYTVTRRLEAPTWTDVAGHYPAEVGARLESLAETRPSVGNGRIILWHGAPGTGKTTAVRALARHWAAECRFQIVLDPDMVFAKSSILMEVLLADEDDNPERWRVLVIEDADELLREDAKDRVGQALSRLLNLGDGILGQGMRVLVLITTNEPVRRLHPALIRPGRCLAEIEFRAFTRTEATTAFGPDIPAGNELTLAHIMQGTAATTEPPVPVGTYL